MVKCPRYIFEHVVKRVDPKPEFHGWVILDLKERFRWHNINYTSKDYETSEGAEDDDDNYIDGIVARDGGRLTTCCESRNKRSSLTMS